MNHIAVGRHHLEQLGRNLIDELVMIVGAAVAGAMFKVLG
jgi:hypothetical protein